MRISDVDQQPEHQPDHLCAAKATFGSMRTFAPEYCSPSRDAALPTSSIGAPKEKLGASMQQQPTGITRPACEADAAT
jgi:hypothetical protein